MNQIPRIREASQVALTLLLLFSSAAFGQSAGRQAAAPMTLTFADAIDRGLRYNLGLIESALTSADAGAARLRALSALRPTVSARAAQVYQDLSLKEVGVTLPGLPPTTGGFGFPDLRLGVSQPIYNGELRNRYRSEQAAERAATLETRDAQDVVVLEVGTAYLQIVARAARLETANAELRSAQEFDRQAADRVKADVAPEIEALRAQVERQTAEQRVIDARNDLEKSKIALARIVGLPLEQPFEIETSPAYRPLAGVTQESAQAGALRSRADLASAAAAVDAAEFNVRAQHAQREPTVGISADYGAGGALPHLNQVYTVAAGVSVPLYTGGRIRADIQTAQNMLTRRRAEYDDLKRRVAYDVRTAWLDLTAADSGVAVARQNTELADRAQAQALDRYANGVTNYLEVVQARETVAQADESLVASLYAFQVAKLSLARAMGDSSITAKEFFRHD
jgi:outer membrane protein TolC